MEGCSIRKNFRHSYIDHIDKQNFTTKFLVPKLASSFFGCSQNVVGLWDHVQAHSLPLQY